MKEPLFKILSNKYGKAHVVFRDPVFSLDKNHTEAVCNQIIKSKYKFRICVEVHLKNIDENLAKIMKKAGVNLIYVGIESGDEEVRDDANRTSESNLNQVSKVKFLEKLGIKSVSIMSNDVKNYPEDSFENMISFSKSNNFSFPYLIDETQDVAKKYAAVCTPDFFGYNKNMELQYRGRIRELKDLMPVKTGDSDLIKAMKLIAETGNGPKNQIPSMGCNIKWFK